MCAGSHVWAQDSASEVDKTFVGKVSQGGRYEVEAGKLALSKAVAQRGVQGQREDCHQGESEQHDEPWHDRQTELVS